MVLSADKPACFWIYFPRTRLGLAAVGKTTGGWATSLNTSYR